MSLFMLAQGQIKFGFSHIQKYQEAMKGVKEIFQSEGIMLEKGMVTKVGKLYQVWNLWKIDDYNHLDRAMQNGANHPKIMETLQGLQDSLESETLHFLEEIDF